MLRIHAGLLLIMVAGTFLGALPAVGADADLVGVIVGRTDEMVRVSLPKPVPDGTIFAVKPLEFDPSIAEIHVVGCTRERPYIATARIAWSTPNADVPVGVRAFAVNERASGSARRGGKPGEGDRFSIQAGAFYPSLPAVRDSVSEYWQAYRLNYSLLKMGKFDAVLSAEYARGASDSRSDAGITERSMEVIPVTLLGRVRTVRMGGTHLFVGGGAGYYHIRSEERNGADLVTTSSREFGHEFTAGLESRKGWILELRYRDVPETNIRGYSLTLGGRF